MDNFPGDLQSRLEQTEEALRKADERAAAGRLALEVMHDIRNPLEAMRNLNYLISVAAGKADDVRHLAKLAEEQIEIVVGIANSMLGFVKSAPRPRPVSLVTLTEAGLRIHQRTIDRKHIHVVRDFHAEVVVPVYPGEVLQVISNLLTNALDASPQGGMLHLRIRKKRHCAQLLIADTGHGIPATHIAQIFEPFFTTKDEDGTGLGLALAKKIVERHSGDICLRSSVRPGRAGTVFRISLPLEKPARAN